MARRRGPKAPVGTPGGRAAQVEVRQRGQWSRWSRYSSTTGQTGGTSATWCRIGSGASPSSSSPQHRHSCRFHPMTRRGCSVGTEARGWWRWPGCPPRFFPEAGVGGRRLTEGGSDEGGLEELVESLLTRSSNSAMRRSRVVSNARMAAWASGGTVSQSGSGIGGASLMPHGIRDGEASSNTRPLNAYPTRGLRVLFRAAAETLQQVATDPEHLGAEIGFLAV